VALQGVLTSRNFLYLVEGEPVARERLTDWELARGSRIFCGVRCRDDALFAAAKGGTLNGEGLKKEVDRMLKDNRITRFIDDFSRQWLQLHRVGTFRRTRSSTPPTMRGSRRACGTSRWSFSARCS